MHGRPSPGGQPRPEGSTVARPPALSPTLSQQNLFPSREQEGPSPLHWPPLGGYLLYQVESIPGPRWGRTGGLSDKEQCHIVALASDKRETWPNGPRARATVL